MSLLTALTLFSLRAMSTLSREGLGATLGGTLGGSCELWFCVLGKLWKRLSTLERSGRTCIKKNKVNMQLEIPSNKLIYANVYQLKLSYTV